MSLCSSKNFKISLTDSNSSDSLDDDKCEKVRAEVLVFLHLWLKQFFQTLIVEGSYIIFTTKLPMRSGINKGCALPEIGFSGKFASQFYTENADHRRKITVQM